MRQTFSADRAALGDAETRRAKVMATMKSPIPNAIKDFRITKLIRTRSSAMAVSSQSRVAGENLGLR